ncbi:MULTISPECIES: endonuclease/exonuclease/phosphatase family protein [Paracoccus]|uniref:endonuclease/exonuclease/phosphatase family protein n=1 Tax=Paracoccus TaxID=265 RepID=UPI00086B7D18|nr:MULTISPECIES: endonuclease/exonuclease/phosphatase family protein [Paracoccus]ODT61163.1 MAG: endonuclease [Paracoccus sp. SCN 68-21]
MDLRALALIALATPAGADTLRLATWDSGLSRNGPGLLLRDIARDDPQVLAAARVIAHAAPDAILLTGFDWDLDHRALTAFAALLEAQGHPMPHRHAGQPNRGLQTGLDLDGDGRPGRSRDAQGYGDFTGQKGLALLSRLPIAAVTDHTATLWRDLPDNRMPESPHADIQRLSSSAHWDVALTTPDGPLHLLAFAATPPAFEPRNAARNHDEATFWLSHLPDAPFAIIGNLNIDPQDGDGDPATLQALLSVTQDPQPRGAFQPPQTGPNANQNGDPALDTAEYDRAPGNLRLDYILPATALRVTDAGVIWPAPDDPLAESVALASHRKLVWVDLHLE